jgi:hypothetical protein
VKFHSGNEFTAMATFCGITMPGIPAINRKAKPASPMAA